MCPSRIIILVVLVMCTSGYTEQNEHWQKNFDMFQCTVHDRGMLMEDMKKLTFTIRNELNSVIGKMKAEQNSVIEDLKPANR